MNLTSASSSRVTPVILLGMHRSGTSCLAGSLQDCGLHLGDVPLRGRVFNPKGNREFKALRYLNDEILRYNGGSWDCPPLQMHWTARHGEARSRLLNELAQSADGGVWGFKDPRTLLTLPFWEDALKEFVAVATIRHPLRVVRSLMQRNDMSPQAALSLWLHYNTALLNLADRREILWIDFDQSPEDYLLSIRQTANQLGLPDTDRVSMDFFEPEFRHAEKIAMSGASESMAIDLYGQLLDRVRRGRS